MLQKSYYKLNQKNKKRKQIKKINKKAKKKYLIKIKKNRI